MEPIFRLIGVYKLQGALGFANEAKQMNVGTYRFLLDFAAGTAYAGFIGLLVLLVDVLMLFTGELRLFNISEAVF